MAVCERTEPLSATRAPARWKTIIQAELAVPRAKKKRVRSYSSPLRQEQAAATRASGV
jgi:hypothetical protein